jgi:hypothetical protein
MYGIVPYVRVGESIRAAILATAGILSEAPEWPEWQRSVRGRTASERLDDLGI